MSLLLDKIFKNDPYHSAINDKHEDISYSQLFEKVSTEHERIKNYIPQNSAVLLSLNNSSTLVIILLALLKNKCKIYLYENKATQIEIDNLAEFYDIPYIISHYTGHVSLNKIEEIYLKSFDKTYQLCKTGIVFFSSGTTHIPKAFFFNENKLYHTFTHWAQYAQIENTDVIFCPLSLTHSHGIMLLLPPLMLGAKCIIQHFEHVDANEYLIIIASQKVTIFSAVPYIYAHFINNKNKDSQKINSLRLCISGSAPLSKHIENQFFKKYHIPISQGYGLSEIGPISINIFAHSASGRNSVGKVIPHIDYKIIDKIGREVPQGMEGELIVKSKWMANFYEKNSDATKETYKDGWLYTQDIVREDEDGFIYITGRKSQFINLAGHKVHPSEVESVLLGIEGVLEALVYPIHDNEKGQRIEAKIVTLYPIAVEIIYTYISKYLPKFKIPSTIHFVKNIQQNSIGKKIERTC